MKRFRTMLLSAALAVSACHHVPDGGPAAGPIVAAPPDVRFQVEQLDARRRPCDDLGAYVNDRWLAAHPVPPDRTTWGVFEMLDERSQLACRDIAEGAAADAGARGVVRLIGDFYASGMDTAAVEAAGVRPIAPILARIDALATPADVARYLRDEFAAGRGDVFSFGAQPDMRNSSREIAYASQGGLALPERAYYLEPGQDGRFARIRTAYAVHVARQLRNAGVADADAATQAADVLAFETRLAKASLSPVELREPAKRYRWVTVAEADAAAPIFSWSAFLRAQGLRVDGFSLSPPAFFAELERMLADVPVAAWRAYLRAHAVDGMAPYLSDRFADEHFDFFARTLRGQQRQKPRWRRVLAAMSGAIGEAIGRLYVERYFPPASKVAVGTLVENLREALRARLEHLEWMSAETRAKAIAKWETFVPKVGYPAVWRSWEGLETSRTSFAQNVLAAAKFDHEWQMGKVGKPVDRREWTMTPQTVNAYYDPLQNEIVFPAAILQPPFFDPAADPALNYGGIGAVIGHEMLHGYDDQGSRYDAQGNLVNWWQESDRERFEARARKLVEQFDGYVAIDGIHVNGALTLGENIADLGGLTVAWDAYRKALGDAGTSPAERIDGFAEDQRFFLNWATVWRRSYTPDELRVRLRTDPHAPARFRVIGAPSNMPQFAAAFGCRPGDAMVRPATERVAIW